MNKNNKEVQKGVLNLQELVLESIGYLIYLKKDSK